MPSVSLQMFNNSIKQRPKSSALEIYGKRKKRKARKSIRDVVMCMSLKLDHRPPPRKVDFRPPPVRIRKVRTSPIKKSHSIPVIRAEHPKIAEFRKILGTERLDKLIRMFRLIDADDSAEIEFNEVVKFNLYLDPNSGLRRIRDDATLLFRLADDDHSGAIDEIEWLHGWCSTIERTGTADFVDRFVWQTDHIMTKRGITEKNIDCVMSFGLSCLPKIFIWIQKAKDAVRKRKREKIELSISNHHSD